MAGGGWHPGSGVNSPAGSPLQNYNYQIPGTSLGPDLSALSPEGQYIHTYTPWNMRPGAMSAQLNREGIERMQGVDIGFQEKGLGLKERLYGPYMGAAGDMLTGIGGFYDRLDLGDIFSNFNFGGFQSPTEPT